MLWKGELNQSVRSQIQSNIFGNRYLIPLVVTRAVAFILVVLVARIAGPEGLVAYDAYVSFALLFLPMVTVCLPDSLYLQCANKDTGELIVLSCLSVLFYSCLSLLAFFLCDIYLDVDALLASALLFLVATHYHVKQLLRILGRFDLYKKADPFVYLPSLCFCTHALYTNRPFSVNEYVWLLCCGYLCVVGVLTLNIANNKFARFELKASAVAANLLRLVTDGILLLPNAVLFLTFMSLFRFVEVDGQTKIELGVAFRLAVVQMIVNTIVLLQAQDAIYKSKGQDAWREVFLKSLIVLILSSFASLILSPLLYHLYFAASIPLSSWKMSALFLLTLGLLGISGVTGFKILRLGGAVYNSLYSACILAFFISLSITHPAYYLYWMSIGATVLLVGRAVLLKFLISDID